MEKKNITEALDVMSEEIDTISQNSEYLGAMTKIAIDLVYSITSDSENAAKLFAVTDSMAKYIANITEGTGKAWKASCDLKKALVA